MKLYIENQETITTYFVYSDAQIVNLPNAKEKVAEIIFSNDKFDRVEFSFKNPYTREQWSILASINELIKKLEKEKNGSRKD